MAASSSQICLPSATCPKLLLYIPSCTCPLFFGGIKKTPPSFHIFLAFLYICAQQPVHHQHVYSSQACFLGRCFCIKVFGCMFYCVVFKLTLLSSFSPPLQYPASSPHTSHSSTSFFPKFKSNRLNNTMARYTLDWSFGYVTTLTVSIRAPLIDVLATLASTHSPPL